MIALIGDVHGNLKKLEQKLKKYDKSICTEIGFLHDHKEFLDYIYQDGKHKVLFGNHDYTPWVNEEHSMKNWSYIEEYDLFTIRGAWSIDVFHRTEGKDWFADEEVSYKEGQEIYDAYMKYKPSVVFAHEIPQAIKKELYGYTNRTITNQLLQSCLDSHAPDIWIHGHYHDSHNTVIDDTLFIGLDECEVYELPKAKKKEVETFTQTTPDGTEITIAANPMLWGGRTESNAEKGKI